MGVWSRPPGGFTSAQLKDRRRRRLQSQIAALVVVTLAGAGLTSHRWVTTVTPVDRTQAVDLFRADRSEIAAGRTDAARAESGMEQEGSPAQRRTHPAAGEEGRSLPGTGRAHEREDLHSSPATQKRPAKSEQDRPDLPEEGVYSWATDGYEQIGGARRTFPEETQRIITLGDRGTWTQHHYFSEERQIWTIFEHGGMGIDITRQRNKVTFGPVTRESKIDFTPPMLAAPRSLREGYEWSGQWSGDIYGDYSGKVFEHTTMDIGGENVEVWVMAYVINLRGEQEGQVTAEVWFAPGPRLTVKEHYVQDVQSGGTRYHAEWEQTLKSLQPRQ